MTTDNPQDSKEAVRSDNTVEARLPGASDPVLTHSQILTYRSRWDPLVLEEVELPPIGPDQLFIQTSCGALNPVDIKVRAISVIPMRHRVCRDYSGTVIAVGSNIRDRYAIGDRVCGKLGDNEPSFVGTITVVEPDSLDVVIPTPERLTDVEAAAFPLVFGAAWDMLECGRLGPEDSVLILGGATSVGVFAIQIARYYYKVKRIVVTASPRSEEYVKGFGADLVLDYHDPHVRYSFVEEAKKNGRFQAIVDAAGGYDAIAVWPEILQPLDHGSWYATIIGDSAPHSTYSRTIWNNLASGPRMVVRLLLGSWLGIDYRHILVQKGFWAFEAPMFFANPKVRVPVDSVYPLNKFREAWARVESTHAHGKVVLRYNE